MSTDDGKSPRQASFGATMKAVFWSFFGVRKRKDYESDAAVFIGILVLAVKMAVAK